MNMKTCIVGLGLLVFFVVGCGDSGGNPSETREEKYIRLQDRVAAIEAELEEIANEEGMTLPLNLDGGGLQPDLNMKVINESVYGADPRVKKLRDELSEKKKMIMALEKT